MKLIYFYLGLLLLGSIIFISLSPQKVHLQEEEEIAQLEFENFKIYEISNEGLSKTLEGEKGEKYKERYVVEMAEMRQRGISFVETLNSNMAIYDTDELFLYGDVIYQRGDGLQFFSDNLTYENKNAFMYVNGAFTLEQNGSIINGFELEYEKNNGKIRALNIDSYILTDNLEKK